MLAIIVPSYNHERYIGLCLQATLHTSQLERRVIVIDDGSSDGSCALVRRFKQEHQLPDSALLLIEKPNAGIVSSLNIGLALADCEFFYVVASDDIPVLDGLQQAVQQLQAHPAAQFLLGGGCNFFEDGQETPLYGPRMRPFFQRQRLGGDEELFLDFPHPLMLQATVFRTDALRSVGGWDADVVLDDYPMFIKLLRRYPRIGVDFRVDLDLPLVRYRHHGSNSHRNMLRQFCIMRQAVDSLLPLPQRRRIAALAVARFFAGALQAGQLHNGVRMLRQLGVRGSLWMLAGVARLVYRKFKRKLLA